jgi:dUTP pyrophosphatase
VKRVPVRVKLDEHARDLGLPQYMSDGASGVDLVAAVSEDLVVNPGQVVLVPTGMHISIPVGYEAQVRPRSGLALKHGITVLNSPGTIDADYRGEIRVILANLGGQSFAIKRGMRIAQMVFQEVIRGDMVVETELDLTERGEGGFGHTGH